MLLADFLPAVKFQPKHNMAKTQKLEYDFVRAIIEKTVTAPDEKARALAAFSKHLKEAAKAADQAKEDNANEEKPVRVFVMTDAMLASGSDEKTGWIVDVMPKYSISNLDSAVQAAITQFNCSRKGKRNPIDTIGNGLEVMGAKLTKENGFHVKTKLPTALVVISGDVKKVVPFAAE